MLESNNEAPPSSKVVHRLSAGPHLLGFLAVCRVATKPSFLPSDLNLSSVVASQLVLSLENANLIHRMVATERLVAIGTLSASIAHEINNPLTNLTMSLPSAIDMATTPDLKKLLEGSLEATKRIAQIMRDMLSMARGDKVTSAIDLNETVQAAFRIARAKIAKDIEVKMDIDTPLKIIGSSGGLGQVFTNLLVNASQALSSQNGGGKIAVRSMREGNMAVMEFFDNGPGIAPANLPKLFTPFFTTKPVGTGTGLGLYICRQIVREHKGEIAVESKPGSTVFRIAIPIADA